MQALSQKHPEKLQNFTFSELFQESLGLEHLAIALSDTQRLLELDISHNEIGHKNFQLLQPIFKININLELLNLADCKIDGEQTKYLCEGLG